MGIYKDLTTCNRNVRVFHTEAPKKNNNYIKMRINHQKTVDFGDVYMEL